MTTIDAIFKDGIFRPTQPVELPNDCHVKLVVEEVAKPAVREDAMKAIHEIMSFRFKSGTGDLGLRHNEHQP
jgi:predicted DNA-binding antitoxin AbrB/MazE fold protein